MTCKITQADVDRSYELVALLEVCKGAAEYISEQTTPGHPDIQVIGALPKVLEQTVQKWSDVHDALEGAMVRDQPEPSEGKP